MRRRTTCDAGGVALLMRPASALAIAVAAVVAGAAVAQALPAGATDTEWQLQRILYMNDTETVPADPTRYTLRFGSDGSVQVRADCNRGTGRYEVDGGSLTFLPIALTRAMCPPDSIDTAFVRELSNVVSFTLDGGTLALATAVDTSILFFEAAADK